MELQKRTLVKTVTYRVAAILATIPFTGLTTALGIHVILMLIYYVHERLWTKVRWGVRSL
jgi:uncharacterized membrane protein